MKIDTATTAGWVYEGAQKKVQETVSVIQESIAQTQAFNREKSDEMKAMAAQQAGGGKRSGGIDVYA